jgi:hypothetical protein
MFGEVAELMAIAPAMAGSGPSWLPAAQPIVRKTP